MVPKRALARESDFQVRHDPSVPRCTLAREVDPQRLDNGYDPSIPRRTLARKGDP